MIGVYVDDLIITGTSGDAIADFKRDMMRLFSMSDLGLLSYYLGIEVTQTKAGITLCQSAYAGKLLERSGLGACNPNSLPMEPRLKLSRTSTTPTVDAMAYRRIIGGLRYLVHTRPDLAYAVGYLSRFMEVLWQEHLAAVKRVLRYVASTVHWGLN